MLSLERQFNNDNSHSNKIGAVEVFTETIENGTENSLETDREEYDDNRQCENVKRLEGRLIKVRELLATRGTGRLETLSAKQASLVCTSLHYWLDKEDSRLYKKNAGNNSLQLVVIEEDKMHLFKSCYDNMGHRGAYVTGKLLQQRFWWLEIEKNVIWYVRTCHLCQIRQKHALEIPSVVTHTPSIFQVLYADTVHMNPPSNRYKYIVHGQCRLSSWMESRALREENAKSIGQWLFEDIICRWGSLVKIVTDNGAPFKKAVKWIEKKYGIKEVTILPYNSQANGVVERPHWDLRQMLYKATGGDIKKWFWSLHHVM